MTEKKKKYLAPEMTFIEVKAADIICTSTTATTEQLQEQNYTW